ncbi:MAG: hypothetical protein KAS32_14030 [Candidatus Peribacteraceae bacterium]|nr:hypothetical protein [Candidatus Peribacteraceae bacterium]
MDARHKIILLFSILFIFHCNLLYAAILQQDNFEYEATRTGTGADALKTTGGWDAIKANNMTGTPNACGYLYTVTSIDGFSGSFPGQSSSRVLCSEHLPYTLDCDQGPGACDGGRWLQSDTYFGYGADVEGYLPANVWIQFWMYPQYYGSQLSRFYKGKFLYSCATGLFSTCSYGGMDWLGVFSDIQSYASFYDDSQATGEFWYSIDTQDNATYDDGQNEATDKLGYNQSGVGKFLPNRWYLVKMNYDMSNANVPIFRMWKKEQGESAWTLVVEWIGGTTEYLTWTADYTDGQNWMTILEMNDCYDMWMFFDDFVIAESELDLPTYGASISIPGNLTISISSGTLGFE